MLLKKKKKMSPYLLTTKNSDREWSDEKNSHEENSNEENLNEKNYVKNVFLFVFKTFQVSKLFIKYWYNFPTHITHTVKLIFKAYKIKNKKILFLQFFLSIYKNVNQILQKKQTKKSF